MGDLSIQPYEGGAQREAGGETSGALVTLPNGLQITEEEQQKRIKDAEELEEKLKYITEKVPTRIMQVMGSNAGAGSGEFHMYRMARRREQFRVQRMEEQAREEEAQKELEEKRQRLQQADDARTAKRRAQRQKKKGKKKRTRPAEGTEGAAAGEAADKSSDSEAQADLD